MTVPTMREFEASFAVIKLERSRIIHSGGSPSRINRAIYSLRTACFLSHGKRPTCNNFTKAQVEAMVGKGNHPDNLQVAIDVFQKYVDTISDMAENKLWTGRARALTAAVKGGMDLGKGGKA